MIIREIGNSEWPTIILLHGGGLSDWSWKRIAHLLNARYHVVTPIIDGHGDDGNEDFISIEDSATKIIHYIQAQHNGRVFAIGGLSIGAQIVCEVLSQQNNIADYAIIESALVYPIKETTALTIPTYKLFYGLVQKRWFSKLQAKTLCVPDELFEKYYQDSLRISKQSLINITLSNGNYPLRPSIADTTAKSLILVGEKEIKIMKKSAASLHQTIKGSSLFVAPKMKHGELSMAHPELYMELLNHLFAK
jgi:hypothetical protein